MRSWSYYLGQTLVITALLMIVGVLIGQHGNPSQ